jgi:leucine-rich PPR motif-containing protein
MARWVDHDCRREAPSAWHHGRDEACREFHGVMESRPQEWQAIISVYKRIPKVASSTTTLALLFHFQ